MKEYQSDLEDNAILEEDDGFKPISLSDYEDFIPAVFEDYDFEPYEAEESGLRKQVLRMVLLLMMIQMMIMMILITFILQIELKKMVIFYSLMVNEF